MLGREIEEKKKGLYSKSSSIIIDEKSLKKNFTTFISFPIINNANLIILFYSEDLYIKEHDKSNWKKNKKKKEITRQIYL